MSTASLLAEVLPGKPRRADARRNYDKLLVTARAAFAEDGTGASLEEIARKAGVGIGTLYRHFPTREALLEAVYVEEVETLCRDGAEDILLPPWEGLVTWLHRFVGYAATKKAIAQELTASYGDDSRTFRLCRGAMQSVGEPLLRRAQESGDARTDVTINDVLKLVGGITMIQGIEPEQLERMLTMAIDGVRPPRA